ncbi:MAG: exonuclease domain-containing protein [Ekhidna sp.]
MPNFESFTAVDFETATWNPSSICQVGLVRVVDGKTVATVNQLIKPPKNKYFYKNIEVHGIRPEDTIDAPNFDEVWHDQIKKYVIDEVFVAHNARFDVNCLQNTLDYYDEVQPDFEIRCTRIIFKRGLSYLSKKYKIPLKHHDALSDANACAQLYLKHLAHQNLPRTGSLF